MNCFTLKKIDISPLHRFISLNTNSHDDIDPVNLTGCPNYDFNFMRGMG